MLQPATTLPEYTLVMNMRSIGETLGPQLIAEIGDMRRFSRKGALVAFAGLDARRTSRVNSIHIAEVFPNKELLGCPFGKLADIWIPPDMTNLKISL